jgi:hypothetical protein
MENQEPEQSGKQVTIGILAFIIGTVVVIYLLKLILS